jgi:DNA repair exonuclease SbcCD nuclease subunit
MGIKICHIADLHIRGLSRHNEVEVVLEKLLQDIISKNVDYLFIGGDFFHSKCSGITPEYIDFATKWLTRLGDVVSVHMILGNHDGLISNASRQDAVSPIVNALNHKNIHLHKHSGVYSFHKGYNWCVYSIFDRENWDSVSPISGDVNIACYHGPVVGAYTESDWEITDGLTVEFFKNKGYEFVMLGDIHKFQYLDFRQTELVIDKDELCNYPDAEVIEEIF